MPSQRGTSGRSAHDRGHDPNDLVASFPEPDRAKFIGDNARALSDLAPVEPEDPENCNGVSAEDLDVSLGPPDPKTAGARARGPGLRSIRW